MKRILFRLSVVVMIILIAGSTEAADKSKLKKLLYAQPWELSTLNGKKLDTKIFSTGTPFFLFAKGGKLTGSTGCNNFNGNFGLKKETLTLDAGAITKMFCQGNGEALVLEGMKSVKNYKLVGDKLKLFDGTKEVMTLVPKK